MTRRENCTVYNVCCIEYYCDFADCLNVIIERLVRIEGERYLNTLWLFLTHIINSHYDGIKR